jgi:glycosyltransferase involved in cell wall biosynthesis
MTSFSVVTPTLNAERYLAECLASVQSQREPNLEHLVVDGGSTDSTERIARQFPSVSFASRPGLNQARAINDGFRRASGEVVAWLNADDAYVEGALSAVLAEFAADPKLDVLIGDCEVIGPSSQHLWWERPGPYDFRRLLRRGNYVAQPAVFLRRRTLEAVGFLDESLELGMDYDLWLRLRGHQVMYMSRALARFRWHADSKSASRQMQSWREALRIVRRYGGGWTPHLASAYVRCLMTSGRVQLVWLLTGSKPLRRLTGGHHVVEHG